MWISLVDVKIIRTDCRTAYCHVVVRKARTDELCTNPIENVEKSTLIAYKCLNYHIVLGCELFEFPLRFMLYDVINHAMF